jgi:hypothetical protein
MMAKSSISAQEFRFGAWLTRPHSLYAHEENEEERTPTAMPAGTITSIIGGILGASGKLSGEDDDEYRARRRRKFAAKRAQIGRHARRKSGQKSIH